MANSNNCPSPRAGPQTRPNWKAGRYLTAEASVLEQNYRLQKLRRHNRELHGWGVLCGLWVVPAADATHPWGVRICPGYALGPYGDEIELPVGAQVNVEDFLWFKPDQPPGIVVIQPVAFVVVRYQDWFDDLTVVPNLTCRCDDPEYLPDRVGDGYQAGVIWTAQPTGVNANGAVVTGVCRPDSLPCDPCPDSPWVYLAAIRLPGRGIPITADMIDNGIRNSV